MARGVPIGRGTPLKVASKKAFDHGLLKLRTSSGDNVHAQWPPPLQVPVSQTNQPQLPLPSTQGRVPKGPAHVRPDVFALVYVDHEGQLRWEMSGKGNNVTREEFCQALVHIMDHGTTEEAPGSNDAVQEPNYHDGRLDSESSTASCDRTTRAVVNERQAGPRSRIPRTQESESTVVALPCLTPFVQPISQPQGSDAEDGKGEEDEYAGAGTLQKQIMVGDEEAMKHYYLTRFKQIQQIPCKSIAKAWIKLIEPKKQVKHPYNGGKKARKMGVVKNGGELTRPDWWPKWGCPHKEPDHQKKGPRLNLLLHMLRDLTNGRVGRDGEEVTVDQLQRSTKDIPDSTAFPQHAREYLEEVYLVRRQELRYLRKEIDPEERISLALPDREPRRLQRKAKPTSRTRRKQGKSQSVPKPAPIITRVPSQQHSLPRLMSPVSQPSLQGYKHESPVNDNGATFHSGGDQPQSKGRTTTGFSIEPTLPDQSPFSQMDVDYSQYYGSLISGPVAHAPFYADSAQQDGSGYALSTKGSTQPLQPLEELQRACTLGFSQMFLQTPIQDTSWQSPPIPQAGQDLASWTFASTPYTPQNTMQMPLPLSGQTASTQQYMSLPLSKISPPYPKDLTLHVPSTSLETHLPIDPFRMASFDQSNHDLRNTYRAHAQQGYFQEQ